MDIQIDKICSKIIRQNKTAKQIMENIRIKFPYIKSTNILDFINKICQICQFNMFQALDGLPYFTDSRICSFSLNDTIIKIPRYIQLAQPISNIIIKNKINKIKYIENDLYVTIKDICHTTFYLRENDTFTIKNIPNAEIKTINNSEYLCFFVECNENCEYIWDCNYFQDNIYPFYELWSNNNGSTEGGYNSIINYDTINTKETFNFLTTDADCTWLAQYNTLNSSLFALRLKLPQNYTSITDKLDISIFAKCVLKRTTEKSIGNGDYIYEIPDNELLAVQNTINNINCYGVLSNNIINDYKDGVKTCKLQIMCQDMYSITGEKIKTWDNGEILEVGDLVRVDKDNYGTSNYTYANGDSIIFRVTGTKFSYNGSPKLDLELQEVKQYT